MDLRRLRAGEWIVGLGGLALIVSLFLPWYEAPISVAAEDESPGGGTLSAWEAFAALDVALALVAAWAVAVLVVTAAERVPAVPIALEALLALIALVALAVVAGRVLSPPSSAGGRDWALWLGLASALAIEAGAWLSMRDERLSTTGRTTDLTGRPVPPPPDIEPLPAPRP